MMEVEASLPDKYSNMSEWYTEILERAELIDNRYGVKGFVVYRPYGMEIMKKIIWLFEKELEKTGHRPVLFPLVIPERNLRRESKHIKGFEGEVFWIEKGGFTPLEERLALRPTSETAIYPLYQLWLKSYRDLPFKAYQTVAVYRYETKATRPLLRGREFLWIETHNVYTSGEEAKRQTEEDAEIFYKVAYEKLGIPFLHIKREEFDKFAGAEETYAFDTLLPDGRVLQIGTTHYLGTNFTEAFEVVIHDEKGGYSTPHSTCFGIGLSRILAAVALLHGDEYGLVLPYEIAPIQVVVIPIYKAGVDNDAIRDYCKEIEDELNKNNMRVVFDDSEKTPGEKYYYYDMRGVPFRIEIGPREYKNKKVTIFRRDIRKRETIDRIKMVDYIREISSNILSTLRERAEERLKKAIIKVTDKEEFIRIAKEKRVIFETFFCGDEECAKNIKEELGGYETRGMPTDSKESGKCIWCGKDGHLTYIAKAY
jgi:prolyl-tRNA synthetase